MAQGLSKVRVARSTAWQQCQEKVVRAVAAKTSSKDNGLIQMEKYCPAFETEKWQVLAVKGTGCFTDEQDMKDAPKIVIVCVQAVFRGCVVRLPSGKTTVRTGRPSSAAMPCSSTRVLHATELTPEQMKGQPNWFQTSCASRPIILDPTNNVIGELTVARQALSQTRLHLQLTPSAAKALELLCSDDFTLPSLRPCVPEPSIEPSAKEHAEAADAELVFDQDSFKRANLTQKVGEFLQALKHWYLRIGHPLTADNDELSGPDLEGNIKFADLPARVSAYLDQQFSSQKGMAFSRSVYSCLKTHVPDRSQGQRNMTCVTCVGDTSAFPANRSPLRGDFQEVRLPGREEHRRAHPCAGVVGTSLNPI